MKSPHKTRQGLTLLELTLALAMTATVMTSLAVLVRGSYRAWLAHESDLGAIEAGHATLRHILRNLRQADSVSAITAKTNGTGSLSLLMPDGTTRVWARNSSTNQVNYGTNSATDLLSEGIYDLRFTGYKADGVTETTVPAEIQAVQATAVVHLNLNSTTNRTIRCWGWVRAW